MEWLTMEICLVDVILGKNQEDVIKYALYNEAEKNDIKIFTQYERPIELEDIIYSLRTYAKNVPVVQRHMKGYDIKNIDFISDDEESEEYKKLIESVDKYISHMGNEEVLEALR